MADNSFPFIVSSGPKLQNDPNVRTIIRKQAMKDVGNARRKRGSRGPFNSERPSALAKTSFPIRTTGDRDSSQESSTTESSDSTTTSDDHEVDEFVSRQPRRSAKPKQKAVVAVTRKQDPFSFAAISLFSNYETARSKFRFDLLDLSMLTSFHVSKATIPVLAKDPSNLASLLGYQHWSYLDYVPSRYGSSLVITAATNCVLGKVKSILLPHEMQCKETMLFLYAKALKTLQDAISDESTCLEADVLCATQLLSIHELLDPARDGAWTQHVNGAQRLIRTRTPERFKTEFEKALFAAHVGPAVSESLMDNSAACYLEQPEWMDLYRSLIHDSEYLDDRSELTINVRSVMFRMPGLWADVGKGINGSDLFDDDALASLARDCRKFQRDLLDWMEAYKSHCVRLSLISPPPRELELRRELLGTAVECLVICKRLLASVCDEEREQLETEVQALARLLLDLQQQPSAKHSWLFTGHEVGIAYHTTFSKEHWEGHFTYDSEYDRKMAIRERYNTWSTTLRGIDG